MSPDDRDEVQRERALQAWELVVLDPPARETLAALRKILRVKRSELPAFLESLPGAVRRGARVDLEALEADLRGAGVRCTLRRSTR